MPRCTDAEKYANGCPLTREAASFPATEWKPCCSVPEPPPCALPPRSCYWPRRPPNLRAGWYLRHRTPAPEPAEHFCSTPEVFLALLVLRVPNATLPGRREKQLPGAS